MSLNRFTNSPISRLLSVAGIAAAAPASALAWGFNGAGYIQFNPPSSGSIIVHGYAWNDAPNQAAIAFDRVSSVISEPFQIDQTSASIYGTDHEAQDVGYYCFDVFDDVNLAADTYARDPYDNWYWADGTYYDWLYVGCGSE